jgi:hypothetical protein
MAQLIDARTDAHLWAQTYDRDFADALPSKATSHEIANALWRNCPTGKSALERKPTEERRGYLAFVRHIISERAQVLETQQSEQLYARATELTRKFSLALRATRS